MHVLQSEAIQEHTYRKALERPIKVCFYVFFPAGGIGRYTHELVCAMRAHPDLKTQVVCTPDFQWADSTGYDTWTGLESISHPIPTLRRARFLRGQFINPVRCIEHAVAEGFDIIHFSNINHFTFPLWRAALEASNVRVVATAHDVLRDKSILSRRWENRQLKAFYQYADALFVHSTYQVNELMEFAGIPEDKIHVVPHGPYPHPPATAGREEVRARLNIPEDQQVGLFFGQVRDEKNLDELIKAMALSASKPFLVVAGQGGGRHRSIESYQQLAERLGLQSQIKFIARYIQDEEVGDLFGMCDWVALPYSNAFTSQSGVLNVAAHYERPVLVSSAPVLRETIETCDIGVVCQGDRAAALAEGIDKIHQRVTDKYSHHFAEYRLRYSWEGNVQKTRDVYRSLLP